MKALVLGAGGFIGNHLVNRLVQEGYIVTGADLKYPDYGSSQALSFHICDLRNYDDFDALMRVCKPDEVYQLAADMGGAGYIFTGEHDADVMHNSAQINLNAAHLAVKHGVKKLFYSSSACMYPQEIQTSTQLFGLKESDAYPGNPDSEYGWEKLFSERLYLAFARNYGLNVRIARFHNIYGPLGTYKGGKEKAPAAICRKAIDATDSMDIWGDGKQTRSFLYIDDCIDAVRLLMQSEFKEPINIGSEEMVSINQLADLAIEFSGKQIEKKYDHTKPQGVRGRNSDNTLIKNVLGWNPKYTLRQGLEKTYNWIKSQYGI